MRVGIDKISLPLFLGGLKVSSSPLLNGLLRHNLDFPFHIIENLFQPHLSLEKPFLRIQHHTIKSPSLFH